MGQAKGQVLTDFVQQRERGRVPLPRNVKFDRNTGAFTWKPTAGQVGKYTFTVQVQGKDRATQTVTDNVTLVVTKPLRAAPTRP